MKPREIFAQVSDCYVDTFRWNELSQKYEEGKVIQAMTFEAFELALNIILKDENKNES